MKRRLKYALEKWVNLVILKWKTGGGISKEDQRNIFDKFYRVSTGEVHNTKGTGLGLTIVKHIMDAHRSKIELDSAVHKGSTFKLMFPNH